MSAPRLAWVGDDFTGASDTLATLATGGARALLFLDVPTPERLERAGPLDAVGIATAVRSMPPAAMREALAPIAAWLGRSGVPLVHYKVCSTWDSAPRVGNVAEAVRALWHAGWAPWVPLVGGQPSLGRWCAHGRLFAQAGVNGPVFPIDRHPTMSRHPVTPMDEPDLGVHLARQGFEARARVEAATLDAGAGAIDAAMDTAMHAAMDAARDSTADTTTDAALGEAHGDAPHPDRHDRDDSPRPAPILFDTLRAAHLAAIGAAIARHARGRTVLAVGASSVAQAALAQWRAIGLLPAEPDPAVVRASVAPADGPVFVLAGSLSPLSARQVAHAGSYERIALDPGRLAARDAAYLARTAADVAARLAQGRHVLAGTALGAAAPREADPALAQACGELLAAVLRRTRCGRVGVVGGDTSSRAVQALAPWALGWVGRLDASTPVVRALADDPAVDGLELMLKGGQMGGEDVLERLVLGSAG